MTETRDLFIQLVLMFQMNAMQALGKIKNPITDRIERNLDGAQFSITMLEMLQQRTRGNLSPDEERLLTQVLQDLRLNYVDEASRKEEPQQTKQEKDPPAEPGETGGTEGDRAPESP